MSGRQNPLLMSGFCATDTRLLRGERDQNLTRALPCARLGYQIAPGGARSKPGPDLGQLTRQRYQIAPGGARSKL